MSDTSGLQTGDKSCFFTLIVIKSNLKIYWSQNRWFA